MRGGQCSVVVAGSVPPQKMQKGLSFNKARFDFLRWDASPMPFLVRHILLSES